MKIVIKAQNDQNKSFILFYQTNHENSFFFKNNTLLGICMIYLNLTICIHIPNIKESINDVCIKARDSRVYMYIY